MSRDNALAEAPAASPSRRPWAALGALGCALAVAAGAYASHGLAGLDQQRMQTASLYLFLHGVALLWLGEQRRGRLATLASAGLATGVLLFSGSLAAAAMLGWPTRLAPLGGSLLILSWLAIGLSLLRRH